MNNTYRLLTINATLHVCAKNETAKNNPPKQLAVSIEHPQIKIVDETEQSHKYLTESLMVFSLSIAIDTFLYNDDEVRSALLDTIDGKADGWELCGVGVSIFRN